MKKGMRCLLLALMLALSFCVGAAAAEQTGAQLSYVTDAAGLLGETKMRCLKRWRKPFLKSMVSAFIS